MHRCIATWDTPQPEVQEQHEADLFALVAAFYCWWSIISAYYTQNNSRNCHILLYSCSCTGDESFNFTFIQTLCFFKPENKLVLEPNSFLPTLPPPCTIKELLAQGTSNHLEKSALPQMKAHITEILTFMKSSESFTKNPMSSKQLTLSGNCFRVPKASGRILADLYLNNISAK